MRKLIIISIILSGLWGGYWFVGSTALETGLKDFLSTKHGTNDPVRIEYSDLSVRGFPNRFDTRLTDIVFSDTQNNINWQAPFLQLYALSYKPNHIIAALPHTQTLQLPNQTLQIDSAEIKGSIVFVAQSLLKQALEIDRSSFVVRALEITSDTGWKTNIKEANIATRQTPASALHYDVAISAMTITLPDSLRVLIDPTRQQPTLLDALSLNSTLGFSHPWDLRAGRGATPKVRELTLNNMSVLWGDVHLQASGTLQVDPVGHPVGRLDLIATNWKNLYDLAKSNNTINPDSAITILNGLKVLAEMSEGENIIKAPLNFANGQMLLGPLPIGPAPRFP